MRKPHSSQLIMLDNRLFLENFSEMIMISVRVEVSPKLQYHVRQPVISVVSQAQCVTIVFLDIMLEADQCGCECWF